MIEIKNGDLLKSNCNIIIHQANCFATMGAGIAKQIKRIYPEAYEVDKNFGFPVGSKKRLGFYTNTNFENDVVVFNLYGQYNYGRGKQTNYKAFEQGLRMILINLVNDFEKNMKIGMPFGVGCGLAGGEWDIIKEIIERLSNKYEVTIFLYKI